MSFKYSCFISYRRNPGDEKFIKNFKVIIESEAQKVTNITKAFFDENSIGWGTDFDKKIYKAIPASYFFIPLYHHSYLHTNNVWCAREIYCALEVEKKIRAIFKDYCFILPFIHRGSPNAMPNCIEKKNVKEIRQLETVITSNKTSAGLTKFKQDIYDIFLENFSLITTSSFNLSELCTEIIEPTDDEIKAWIEVQKGIQRKKESENLPILKKNA